MSIEEFEMRKSIHGHFAKSLVLAVALAVAITPLATFAQTQIKLHNNKYSPADDVKLGRQAAAEARQKFPLLRGPEVGAYFERVGQRLVTAIPPEFQHREFRYSFKVINASDINAFALPGGPMYVDRGMIEAARTEGEMAGVMAHEISHVALRHGTAQATKAQKYNVLGGILGIGGAIIGGPAGAAAQVAHPGVGVYFLTFSRGYETEAHLPRGRDYGQRGYRSAGSGECSSRARTTGRWWRRISQRSSKPVESFRADQSGGAIPGGEHCRASGQPRVLRYSGTPAWLPAGPDDG